MTEQYGRDAFPYAPFPEPGGVLPWGETGGEGYLLWRTRGEPDVWTIVVGGRGRPTTRSSPIRRPTSWPACSPAGSTAASSTSATCDSAPDIRPFIVADIGVGDNPGAVVLDVAAHRVYVTNNDSIFVIDTRRNVVAATIHLSSSADDLAVDPSARRAYVTHYGDIGNGGNISVIDTRRNAVVATIRVGYTPDEVVVDPITHRAYVTNYGGSSVSVIDMPIVAPRS